jgi:hypothetical protein
MFVELPSGRSRPAMSRLEANEIPFELPSETRGASVRAVYAVNGEAAQSVTDIMAQPQLSFMPFNHNGGQTELWIGLDDISAGKLRLYFEIDDALPVSRNPFDGQFMPRGIEWSLQGAQSVQVEDETHALSISGYVSLEPPEIWPVYEGDLDVARLRYISLKLADPGCEERVRLNYISANRHIAVQRETWSHLSSFTASEDRQGLTLTDEISRLGALFVFVRESTGLRQAAYEPGDSDAKGRSIIVDTGSAARDGEPNVFIVSADALHELDLFFDSNGLPNQSIELPLFGKKLLTDGLGLICDTQSEDGIRPAFWHYTDDLGILPPHERAFTVDYERERLVFGDGEHGAIVPRGENAIFLAPAAVSLCERGNVPGGSARFTADSLEVQNSAASGGAAAQSPKEAARAFLIKLEDTNKCASAKDYERAALKTPGLRVQAAKALPGYDPDEPAGRSVLPIVSVVAIPYSGEARPKPDARFLGSAAAHLSRLRPICTKVKVIAPRYAPIGLFVQVRAKNADAAMNVLRQAARQYFELGSRSIGDGVVRNDLIMLFMKLDVILAVERLELTSLGPECYSSENGDIHVPRDAVAYLGTMDMDVR